MVYFMENPFINRWFGGTPISGNLHIPSYPILVELEVLLDDVNVVVVLVSVVVLDVELVDEVV